jgi:hypothetical protein
MRSAALLLLVSVAAVIGEFDRMAGLPLWPGFEPKSIPLAIWDGEQTWLVRHPAPPEGFVKKVDYLWVFRGRHPALRANSSAELGGVRTATLLLDAEQPRTAREWASILVHETFHVFQRERHPAWQGNETELFVYPVDDTELLARRRLETEALRRAVLAAVVENRPRSACWAARALDQRRVRFARLPPGSAGYERGTELNEGLAAYVEELALGATGTGLPPEGYGAGEVREAAYGTGPALATLLDRFDPSWKATLEAGSTASLDELLMKALPLADTAGCGFTAEEVAQARARAAADVARLVAGRKERRAAFFAQPGLRLEIDAGAEPLWPQGFDPLNVEALGGPEVLHRRWLKLGNERGTLEVLDREALTEGAAGHPLFNGVRRLTLAGLAAEPVVSRDGATLKITAPGLTATLQGAVLDVTEKSRGLLRVTWPEAVPARASPSPTSATACSSPTARGSWRAP